MLLRFLAYLVLFLPHFNFSRLTSGFRGINVKVLARTHMVSTQTAPLASKIIRILYTSKLAHKVVIYYFSTEFSSKCVATGNR